MFLFYIQHGEVQVDEQKRVLQHKYDVLQHGFEVLKHIPCYDNKPMKIRQDDVRMMIVGRVRIVGYVRMERKVKHKYLKLFNRFLLLEYNVSYSWRSGC